MGSGHRAAQKKGVIIKKDGDSTLTSALELLIQIRDWHIITKVVDELEDRFKGPAEEGGRNADALGDVERSKGGVSALRERQTTDFSLNKHTLSNWQSLRTALSRADRKHFQLKEALQLEAWSMTRAKKRMRENDPAFRVMVNQVRNVLYSEVDDPWLYPLKKDQLKKSKADFIASLGEKRTWKEKAQEDAITYVLWEESQAEYTFSIEKLKSLCQLSLRSSN
jgi:hypothetical protein